MVVSLLTPPPISMVSETVSPVGTPGGTVKTISLVSTEAGDEPRVSRRLFQQHVDRQDLSRIVARSAIVRRRDLENLA